MSPHPRSSKPGRKKQPAWVVILTALILAGIQQWQKSQPESGRKPVPEAATQPASEPTSAFCTKVFDGDTIEVRQGKGRYKVRIIGIDTMDSHNEEKTQKQAGYHNVSVSAVRALSKQATAETRKLVDGKEVLLFTDPASGDSDPYGRKLRYVFVNGQDLGEHLLRRGLAEPRRESHSKRSAYHSLSQPLAFR